MGDAMRVSAFNIILSTLPALTRTVKTFGTDPEYRINFE